MHPIIFGGMIVPYKSKSQLRRFFAMESRGDLPKGTARRWAHHTPDIKALPEHVDHAEKKSSDLRAVLSRAVSLYTSPSSGVHQKAANAQTPFDVTAFVQRLTPSVQRFDTEAIISNLLKLSSVMPAPPAAAPAQRSPADNLTQEIEGCGAQSYSRIAVKFAELHRHVFLDGPMRSVYARQKLAFAPPQPAAVGAVGAVGAPGALEPSAQAAQGQLNQLMQAQTPATQPVLGQPPTTPGGEMGANTPSTNPIGLMSGLSTDPTNVNGNAAFGTQNNVVKLGGVLIPLKGLHVAA